MSDTPEDNGDDSISRDTAENAEMVALRNFVRLADLELETSPDSMHADSTHEEDIDLGSDSGDEVPFDIQLPYQHLYLARKFHTLPGHTYLEAGTVTTLPLLPSSLMTGASVLIPGQTVPLNYSPAEGYSDVVQALRGSLANTQNLFAFMYHRWLPNSSRARLAKEKLANVLGVTLEVFEVGEGDEEEEEQNHQELCCKARVTHRFRLLETCAQTRGQWVPARVLILPEVVLNSPLHQARSSNPAVPTLRAAGLTRWPDFVYRQYEQSVLVETAKQYCLQLLNVKTECNSSVPEDPVQLSFWILSNFPLSDSLRIQILCLDNSLQRLQTLINYFKKQSHFWTVRCQTCENSIAHMKDVFFMSSTGFSVTYANPSGYLHETLTALDVIPGSVLVDVMMSTQYSWFPGYSWQITSCAQCRCHVGWLFKSGKKGLVPKKFYGITKRAIIIPSIEPKEDDPELTSSPYEASLDVI